MAKVLSYTDAVKLLGGDGKIVTAIDRVTGGLLLAGTLTGNQFAAGLFDPKAELVRLGKELVTELTDRLHGLDRLSRTERLAAAHVVIVITAYFEALGNTKLPFSLKDVNIRKSEQIAVAAGGPSSAERLGTLARRLLVGDTPMLSPELPFGDMKEALNAYYSGSLFSAMLSFLEGLDIWDRLSQGERDNAAKRLRLETPSLAVTSYEDLFLKLAASFPEVVFWTAQLDHQATRQQITSLRTGLNGLAEILSGITSGRETDAARTAIATHHRSHLSRPIVETGDAPDGLVIPTLETAYINPRYRVGFAQPAARIDQEQWWDDREAYRDLQELLIGHLTSPHAPSFPLVVLGQPGSGKSVLTKMLAARLPATDFLVVRVVLRDVPADTDLLSQIEHAIRDLTKERMSWREFTRLSDGALPVVLLDGFDELLQATGVSQSDYLDHVQKFQERERGDGHPVAVLVTSRTAVADRARIPIGGAVVVRLEPFDRDQVDCWISIWNLVNASGYLAELGLEPLQTDMIWRYQDLASQPLLLLMLALYDAEDNALQREAAELELAELYERLLKRFAEREVRKTRNGLGMREFSEEVERELLRISVAAFSMFNRGRQWATEDEINDDLGSLLDERISPQSSRGFRAPLTAGAAVIGKFFFVHQAEATRAGIVLATCEFLHATFGEFLVARLIARELTELAGATASNLGRARPVPLDDSFLYALLSFTPLSGRIAILDFLVGLRKATGTVDADGHWRLLVSAFHGANEFRTDRHLENYQPISATAPARCAMFSSNLLLLLIIFGRDVTATELFPEAADPMVEWRRHALLWRSQMSPENWASFVTSIAVHRHFVGGVRDLTIAVNKGGVPIRALDLLWTFDSPRDQDVALSIDRNLDIWRFRYESYVLCDPTDDIVMHALEPVFISRSDVALTTFGTLPSGQLISVAHALLGLLGGAHNVEHVDRLLGDYQIFFDAVDKACAPDSERRVQFIGLALRLLVADAPNLPPESLDRLRARVADDIRRDSTLKHWGDRAFPQKVDPPA